MYTITKEELIKLIKNETNVGFKRILENHLRVMEGEVPDCTTCVLEDDVEEVVEDGEE